MKKIRVFLVGLVGAIALGTFGLYSMQHATLDEIAGPRALCDAAAPTLRESGANHVSLVVSIDRSGNVESFETELPKGVRLENVSSVATQVKNIHFEPAKKDGQAVEYKARIVVDCPAPVQAASASAPRNR
jgi:hypothetical protein